LGQTVVKVTSRPTKRKTLWYVNNQRWNFGNDVIFSINIRKNGRTLGKVDKLKKNYQKFQNFWVWGIRSFEELNYTQNENCSSLAGVQLKLWLSLTFFKNFRELLSRNVKFQNFWVKGHMSNFDTHKMISIAALYRVVSQNVGHFIQEISKFSN
jgi:hypothetical protein